MEYTRELNCDKPLNRKNFYFYFMFLLITMNDFAIFQSLINFDRYKNCDFIQCVLQEIYFYQIKLLIFTFKWKLYL